jgi:Na+/serine symporter
MCVLQDHDGTAEVCWDRVCAACGIALGSRAVLNLACAVQNNCLDVCIQTVHDGD